MLQDLLITLLYYHEDCIGIGLHLGIMLKEGLCTRPPPIPRNTKRATDISGLLNLPESIKGHCKILRSSNLLYKSENP